jgi:prophage tail gpP-like protein
MTGSASDSTQIPTLTVGGKIYQAWEEIEITRQIDHMCSTFRIKVAERFAGGGDVWQITPFSPCTIKIGSDLVLTGYVDAYRPEYDRGSHTVEIIGRSRTEDIVDCTPDIQGGQFAGYTLDAIARAIAAPFNIPVIVQAPMGDPFPDGTIQRHETGFAFLERLARLRSVLLSDDAQGRLVLTAAGAGKATDPLVEGQNVERATAELNGARRFSIYKVKTQQGVTTPLPGLVAIPNPTSVPLPPTGSYASRVAAAASFAASNDPPQTPVITVTAGAAVDPGVPRFRPHVLIAESGLNATQAQARAVWQAKYNAARAVEVSIEAKGWRQSDGTLWQCNTLATVNSPMLQINAQLLIAGVSYILQRGRGRMTRLRLGPVDGYQPDPGQVKVRKPRGGAAPQMDLKSIATIAPDNATGSAGQG